MYTCDIHHPSQNFYYQRFSHNATLIFTDQEPLTIHLFREAYQRYFSIKEIHTTKEKQVHV
ncbi:hypothetical protein [Bacteroides faecalis]|uniref:hypothetical protein n=1 Tax=Bacteroides faecalis TaxID=2447885 RepID=UPI001F166716|nr:hypothetical protein [Bacteroides faecalis]